MPEHQQTHQSKSKESFTQRRTSSTKQTHISNPAAIIQRARIDPKSLTSADVLQLQRTIGNRAVGRLLSEIKNPSTAQQAPVQKQEIPEEEPLQGVFEKEPEEETCTSCVQRQKLEEEEEPLQGVFGKKPEQSPCSSCSTASVQQKEENRTGMPDDLKAGVESLSGIDMSDVRVHYNSSKPAEIGALAYTQGIDIHVAPRQERHLPHEAWHVVQQAQGRVKPTMQLKDVGVDDDVGLEREADEMGTKAFQFAHNRSEPQSQIIGSPVPDRANMQHQQSSPVIQRTIIIDEQTYKKEDLAKFEAQYKKEEFPEMLSAMCDIPHRPKSILEALEDPRSFRLTREEGEGKVYYLAEADPLPERVVGGITREAGKTPVLVKRPDNGFEELKISGLIMCIGIIIEARKEGEIQAVSGSHFTTPDCISEGKINSNGKFLLEEQVRMVQSYGTLSAILMYVKYTTERKTEDQSQALEAVNLIVAFLQSKGLEQVQELGGASTWIYKLQANGTRTLM